MLKIRSKEETLALKTLASEGRSLITPESQEKIDLLRQINHFKKLPDHDLRLVSQEATWEVCRGLQYLIKQGDQSDSVFILVQGRLQFDITNSKGQTTARGILRSGDVVGDISIFLDSKAPATVFATRDSQLLKMSRTTFISVLESSPKSLLSVTQKIVALASEPLHESVRPLKCQTIAIVSVDETVPTDNFMKKFSDALNHHGKCIYASKEFVANHLGQGFEGLTPEDPQYFHKMKIIKKFMDEYDYLLYRVGKSASSWNLSKLRQVDKILLLTSSRHDGSLSEVEQHLCQQNLPNAPQTELVIIQESETIKKTSTLLAKRSVFAHHHVWLDRTRSLNRLARIITGNSIGLVLGGGGARAAAQIGVIRALEEAGIPIDHIGGTSIGAFAAALYASGLDSYEMEKITLREVVGNKLFSDYTFPFVSLVRGAKVTKLFQKIFGFSDIEDTPIDYFATSVNLTSGKLEIFDKGKIWESLRASSSLPAILPPFVNPSGVYVDGGILDNIPEKPMRDRGVGFVIAVDVSGSVNAKTDQEYYKYPQKIGIGDSAFRVCFNKILSKAYRYPSIAETITRSMIVGGKENAELSERNSDIFIRLPVGDTGLFDFNEARKLIEIGYDYSSQRKEQWKRQLKRNKI